MKKLFLLLVFGLGMVCTALAQTPSSSPAKKVHTPSPPYPADALQAKVTGSGTCQVVFDASGHVATAVMTKSTGSTVLNENTISFAKKNWTGPPTTKVSVPIQYQLTQTSSSTKAGACRVVFDEAGHVRTAVVTETTGSKGFDDNAVKYALGHWTGQPNTATQVVITPQSLTATYKHSSNPIRITGIKPPYPYVARAAHTEGSGVIQLTFDATGKPISAVMTTSTGSELLDQNTLQYVLTTWKSTGTSKMTLSYPITYRLL